MGSARNGNTPTVPSGVSAGRDRTVYPRRRAVLKGFPWNGPPNCDFPRPTQTDSRRKHRNLIDTIKREPGE
jgi:hypothetical protein